MDRISKAPAETVTRSIVFDDLLISVPLVRNKTPTPTAPKHLSAKVAEMQRHAGLLPEDGPLSTTCEPLLREPGVWFLGCKQWSG